MLHILEQLADARVEARTFSLPPKCRQPPGVLRTEENFQSVAAKVDHGQVLNRRACKDRVELRLEIAFRFNYGKTIPWVQRLEDGIEAIAGPDLIRLWTTAGLHGENLRTLSDFVLRPGDRVPFIMRWAASYVSERPRRLDAEAALQRCDDFWRTWAKRCIPIEQPYAEPIKRSLLTLKALTFAPTGGIVAAPTSALLDRGWRMPDRVRSNPCPMAPPPVNRQGPRGTSDRAPLPGGVAPARSSPLARGHARPLRAGGPGAVVAIVPLGLRGRGATRARRRPRDHFGIGSLARSVRMHQPQHREAA